MAMDTTLTGVVATTPSEYTGAQGVTVSSFRLAVNNGHYDTQRRKWVNGETVWFTVASFRRLAENAVRSIRKGDRVIVHGRLHLRNWESGTKKGTNVEVEAYNIGHDLFWGTSEFTRNNSGDATTEPESLEELD